MPSFVFASGPPAVLSTHAGSTQHSTCIWSHCSSLHTSPACPLCVPRTSSLALGAVPFPPKCSEGRVGIAKGENEAGLDPADAGTDRAPCPLPVFPAPSPARGMSTWDSTLLCPETPPSGRGRRALRAAKPVWADAARPDDGADDDDPGADTIPGATAEPDVKFAAKTGGLELDDAPCGLSQQIKSSAHGSACEWCGDVDEDGGAAVPNMIAARLLLPPLPMLGPSQRPPRPDVRFERSIRPSKSLSVSSGS